MMRVTKFHVLALWVIGVTTVVTGVTLSSNSSQEELPDKALEEKYNACDCKGKTPRVCKNSFYHIEGDADENSWYSITCCAKEYIGTNAGDFNITWSFTGKKTVSSTLKPLPECFGQISSTNRVDFSEAGSHSCTITTRNGSSFTMLIDVRVHAYKKEGATPVAHNVSDPIYTSEGSSATLKCTYYLEKGSIRPDVFWRKYWYNDSRYFEQIASTLGNTQETFVKESKENIDVFVYQLTLLNITKQHFGNYSCKAITASEIITQNLTLVQGLDPITEAQMESRNSLISAISGLVLFMIFVFLSFRYRYLLAWKWKRLRTSMEDSPSGFYHDIFVVHGPSASFWVYGTLMEKLEGEWSYDCFAPERDLLGGEVSTKVICQKLGMSKEVVIVVSDCLLQSQWCSYVTLHAIHKSLTNSTRVIAITLTDLKDTRRFPEGSQTLINILKAIKKIPYPMDYSPMELFPHINGNAFRSDELNDICKPKCSILLNHSIERVDNKGYKEVTDEQHKSIPNSSSSPNIISDTCISRFSSSSSSLPLLFVYPNIKSPKSSVSKILSTQNSCKYETKKQARNSESKVCGQFLHSNMILGGFHIRPNDTTSQDENHGQGTELSFSDEKSNGTKHTESDIKFKPGNSENLEKDVLSYTESNSLKISPETMSANHLEDIEICTPLNASTRNNPYNQTKKRVRCPFSSLIVAEPTEMFWQKLRLHLPIKRQENERRKGSS